MPDFVNCHVCGHGPLYLQPAFEPFHLVTSDCKPWRTGGKKGCCPECGTVQAAINEGWKEACHQIYTSYSVYHQGGGQEQPVFAAGSNAGTPRSLKLLEKMTTSINLPEQGRALDIGCGNGNFIRSFAAIRPQWRLNGAEYNTLYQNQVLAIPGVEAFFSGELETIPGPFDFVSLIHVLEHIENPVPFLRKIGALAPNATLLIEVPFFQDNPYELLIADHATHYTPTTLARVLRLAGFSVQALHTDWIVKEISAVAVPSASMSETHSIDPKGEQVSLVEAIGFLGKVRDHAKNLRSTSPSFGIFGTSIGGTWLYSELGGKIDFYVDEDPARIGKTHLDVPIYSPAQVPAGSSVFLPLADRIARDVATRLQSSTGGIYHFYAPEIR